MRERERVEVAVHTIVPVDAQGITENHMLQLILEQLVDLSEEIRGDPPASPEFLPHGSDGYGDYGGDDGDGGPDNYDY